MKHSCLTNTQKTAKRTRQLVYMFTFILFCLPNLPAYGQNLIANGDFEEWGTATNTAWPGVSIATPTGWSISLGDGNMTNLYRYNQAQSDIYSVILRNTRTSNSRIVSPPTTASLEAGKVYRLTYWIRGKGTIQNVTLLGATVTVNGTYAKTPYATNLFPNGNTTALNDTLDLETAWTKKEYTYTVQSAGQYKLVFFITETGDLSGNADDYLILDNVDLHWDVPTPPVVKRQLYPTDDTYIYRGDYAADADVIRGLDDPNYLKIYTHQNDDGYSHKTCLKFDLKGICNNPGLIRNVTLKMTGKEDQGAFEHHIGIYTLPNDDAWAEDNLTFRNQSILGTPDQLYTLTKTIGTSDVVINFDITETIKEYKAAGKNVVSIMLSDTSNVRNPDNNKGSVIKCYSKEATGNGRPYLMVTEEDASSLLLTGIKINDVPVDDFNPNLYHYPVDIEEAWTGVPSITWTQADENASAQLTPAQNLTGTEAERTARIEVSKEGNSLTYTIVFVPFAPSTDVSLKEILIDGNPLEFLSAGRQDYTHRLPYNYSGQSPQITWTQANKRQTVTCLPAVNILSENTPERTATVRVVSSDLSEQTDYRIVFEKLPKLDLYLCIGQSNMAGRGPMDPDMGDLDVIPRCFLFTPGFGFEEASNPMNKYSNVRSGLSQQQISPAYGFAKKLSEQALSANIGMVVNARGATSIEEWSKGKDLYTQTVNRMKKALPWGEFKAILWHQGEGNSSDVAVSYYMKQLQQMVADLRTEWASPDVYFLAGELNHVRTRYETFNDSLHQIHAYIPNADWVSSEGLTALTDSTHFDRQSAIVLGERYAEKVITKYYPGTSGIENRNLPEQTRYVVAHCGRNVTIKGIEQPAVIVVYDIYGRKRLSENIATDSYSFSLPERGIYILSIANKEFASQTKILLN